jgi:hypothetical protein
VEATRIFAIYSPQSGSGGEHPTSHNTHYEEQANTPFIPSDQSLRWFVGKQDMISRKQ